MICFYSKLFEANFSSFVPLYKITERKVFSQKKKQIISADFQVF